MKHFLLANMSKAYGGVPALCDVSLTLEGGRVHALMGENGAGKSTLIKLIAGVVPADSLRVEKDGQTVTLVSATDAYAAGFRFIHQELNIVPQISVAENILLGRDYPRRFGIAINWRRMRTRAQAALDFLGADHIDVDVAAATLSAGDKMLIKIAAALVTEDGAEAELYVLDEPTAALSDEECAKLFEVIRRLKSNGTAILYVSHRIDEVLDNCDDVTVLRDGRNVSSRVIAETSKDEIIRDMTGRDVKDAYPPASPHIARKILTCLRDVHSERLRDLNFDLREGEILGVCGLADAGQSQVLKLFLGLEPVRSGSATFAKSSLPTSPSQAWQNGIAFIPRERRGEALMLNMAIRSNIVLPHLGKYGFRAKKNAESSDARSLGEKVHLKYDGTEQPVGQLSGGNQQKVVFARALFGNPRLLLLDEPTRGVDVGAKYDIYLLVRKLCARGCTVILTSTDLPEILGMCDRILVLQDGRQAHLLERGTLTSADLLSHFYAGENA